jgi:hypothetical protein
MSTCRKPYNSKDGFSNKDTPYSSKDGYGKKDTPYNKQVSPYNEYCLREAFLLKIDDTNLLLIDEINKLKI